MSKKNNDRSNEEFWLEREIRKFNIKSQGFFFSEQDQRDILDARIATDDKKPFTIIEGAPKMAAIIGYSSKVTVNIDGKVYECTSVKQKEGPTNDDFLNGRSTPMVMPRNLEFIFTDAVLVSQEPPIFNEYQKTPTTPNTSYYGESPLKKVFDIQREIDKQTPGGSQEEREYIKQLAILREQEQINRELKELKSSQRRAPEAASTPPLPASPLFPVNEPPPERLISLE